MYCEKHANIGDYYTPFANFGLFNPHHLRHKFRDWKFRVEWGRLEGERLRGNVTNLGFPSV